MQKNKLRQMDVPFTQVPTSVLQDKDLSYDAKGVYAYLLTNPTSEIMYDPDFSGVMLELKKANLLEEYEV